MHVPFCASICYYCDFAHTVYQKENAEKWLEALCKEIEHKKINRSLKTIYIGGGTPVSLTEEQLERLLDILKPYSACVKEYTCEVNPETLSEEKAKIMARYGINRVSIGFQCAQDNLLRMLGRRHSAKDVEHTVSLLRSQGIDNISLDLMYSLPHQDMDMLR